MIGLTNVPLLGKSSDMFAAEMRDAVKPEAIFEFGLSLTGKHGIDFQ